MLRIPLLHGRFLPWATGLLLLSVALGLIGYKIFVLGYRLSDVLPESRYQVKLAVTLDGHDGDVTVRTFLPRTDERQRVFEEANDSPELFLKVYQEGLNRRAVWSRAHAPNQLALSYTFEVAPRAVRYQLPEGLELPERYPASIESYLRPEEAIQVDHSEIVETAERIGANHGDVRHRLRVIFDKAAGLAPRSFKGTTDALTALRLGEASCNGKSRLFVALSRASGIPARLVGGLILEPGEKRTSHQWVEAYVNGYWVPFGPTNGHFASLPGNYLTLYRDDEALFTHTSDINFDYLFETSLHQVPSEKAKTGLEAINVWALFERLGLPFSLLRTLLMLPIGALVVVVARNVVGVPTFGTFLPALIAAAMLQTGALWGVVGLLGIICTVAVVRLLVQRLRLLHSPTLAILLAAVTLTMLGTSLVADRLEIRALTRISLFPIAVLAISAERFYISLADHGLSHGLRELAGTLLVILACYLLMHSLALQALVVGFPEVLLVVVAMDAYLGTWTGIRISEHLRFRGLLLRRAS